MITVHHFSSDNRDVMWEIQWECRADLVQLGLMGFLPDTRYEVVATVDTDCPDIAYQLTNHIDGSWTDNPKVTLNKRMKPECMRSTSVGDVMTWYEGNQLVIAVVAKLGFKELSRTDLSEIMS